MSNDAATPRSQAETDLEREIRAERKFTLSEAIGRLAGPGMMKGVSPVSLQKQARIAINEYLKQHLSDTAGVLPGVLCRQVADSELLLHNLEQPLNALAGYVSRLLDSESLLQELVRQTDVEWGQVYGERPYFERKGKPPQPDDPYTLQSVRAALSGLSQKMNAAGIQATFAAG